MTRITPVIVALLGLTACDSGAPLPRQPLPDPMDKPRVNVVRSYVFVDDTSGNQLRGVYIRTDVATGQRSIGVLGLNDCTTECGADSLR